MPTVVERVRRLLPAGLTGLAGTACAACCVIPLLLAAGVLSGAGWALAGAWMPGVAVVLAVFAGTAWWWARRRQHRGGCAGGETCACGT
jgi:protein-S-isoprenylcysteine O-methyltransferase Ste14